MPENMGSSRTWIDLIRHGEPAGGLRIRGQTDDPLTELGWEQMRVTLTPHGPWEGVVSSPLLRCRAFAEAVSAQFGVALRIDPRLKEIGFGEWEGRSHHELTAEEPDRLLRFWMDPKRYAPTGAEPVEEFAERVAAAFDDLVTLYGGQRVLVVCHAGTIRMTLSRVLGFPPAHAFRIKVPYAGLTQLQVEHRGVGDIPFLLSHGNPLE